MWYDLAMTEDEFRQFIEKESWIFAKTYAQKAPHEYIVRNKINATDEDFVAAAEYIQNNGITMHYWGHPNKYLFIGDKYYWVMKAEDDDPTMIINRANTSDYQINVVWKG